MKNILIILFAIQISQVLGEAAINRILEERISPWDEANHLQLRSVLVKADDFIELGFSQRLSYIALYQIIKNCENGPDRILRSEPYSAAKFRIYFHESINPDADIHGITKDLMEFFYIPHENLPYFPAEEAGSIFYIEDVPYQSLDAVAYLALFSQRVPQITVTSGPEPLAVYFPSGPKWWHYEYASPFLNVTIDESSGKRVTWFGEVNDAMYPVVEHPGHGLVEVEYTRIEGVLHLWWEDVVFGRCYTREEIYPYIYCERDDEWLYYLLDSSDPRWFYSLKYEGWAQYQ